MNEKEPVGSTENYFIPQSFKKPLKLIITSSNFSKMQEPKLGTNIHKNALTLKNLKHNRNSSSDTEKIILGQKKVSKEKLKSLSQIQSKDLFLSKKITSTYKSKLNNNLVIPNLNNNPTTNNTLDSKKINKASNSLTQNDYEKLTQVISTPVQSPRNGGFYKIPNQIKSPLIKMSSNFNKDEFDATNIRTPNYIPKINVIDPYKSDSHNTIDNKSVNQWIIKKRYELHKAQGKHEQSHASNFVYSSISKPKEFKNYKSMTIKPIENTRKSKTMTFDNTYSDINLITSDNENLKRKFKNLASEEHVPIFKVVSEDNQIEEQTLEYELNMLTHEKSSPIDIKRINKTRSKLKNLISSQK